MKDVIGMTVGEIERNKLWSKVCEIKNLDKNILNLRLITRNDVILFNKQEALDLGIWAKES